MSDTICLSDWDGTLRRGYVVRDWMEYLLGHGIVSKNSVARMLSYFDQYEGNRIQYPEMAEMIVRTYAESLCGQHAKHLEGMAREFVARDEGIFEFATPLISYLRDAKIDIVIVTGAPAVVVRHFAHRLNIKSYHALELATDNAGVFVGKVAANTALKEQKQIIVDEFKKRPAKIVLALGDSSSDEPLFDAATHAFYIATENLRGKSTKAALTRPHLRVVSPDEMLWLVEARRIL